VLAAAGQQHRAREHFICERTAHEPVDLGHGGGWKLASTFSIVRQGVFDVSTS
jgi:hypothetical protein